MPTEAPVADWVTIPDLHRDPFPIYERLRAEGGVQLNTQLSHQGGRTSRQSDHEGRDRAFRPSKRVRRV